MPFLQWGMSFRLGSCPVAGGIAVVASSNDGPMWVASQHVPINIMSQEIDDTTGCSEIGCLKGGSSFIVTEGLDSGTTDLSMQFSVWEEGFFSTLTVTCPDAAQDIAVSVAVSGDATAGSKITISTTGPVARIVGNASVSANTIFTFSVTCDETRRVLASNTEYVGSGVKGLNSSGGKRHEKHRRRRLKKMDLEDVVVRGTGPTGCQGFYVPTGFLVYMAKDTNTVFVYVRNSDGTPELLGNNFNNAGGICSGQGCGPGELAFIVAGTPGGGGSSSLQLTIYPVSSDRDIQVLCPDAADTASATFNLGSNTCSTSSLALAGPSVVGEYGCSSSDPITLTVTCS